MWENLLRLGAVLSHFGQKPALHKANYMETAIPGRVGHVMGIDRGWLELPKNGQGPCAWFTLEILVKGKLTDALQFHAEANEVDVG